MVCAKHGAETLALKRDIQALAQMARETMGAIDRPPCRMAIFRRDGSVSQHFH